jgi:hypothetical protein
MPNAIRLKRSGTANSAPQATDLQLGELALNYNDGKLYYKTSAGTVSAIANGIAPVTSVAGRTGTIVLTASDISSGLATVATSGSASDLSAGTLPAARLPTTAVQTVTTGITGATTVTNIVQLTQAQYNAITTPVSTTLYVIVG